MRNILWTSMILSDESQRLRPPIVAFDLKWRFAKSRVYLSSHRVCIFSLVEIRTFTRRESKQLFDIPRWAFIDIFAWYGEHFMGVSILLARRKNGQIFDDNFYFCCSFPLSRLGLLTVFLPSFILCFLLCILLRTKFSIGKLSRTFWRARALLSKPADTKRDSYSAKRSPVVKPIARYRKPGIIRIIISARFDQTIAVYFVDVRKHAHVPVWTIPRSRCTHSGLTVTAFDAPRRFIKFRVLNERHRGITRAICLFVPWPSA